MRFRDFARRWREISFKESEQKKLVEGFMVGLGMFAFLYSLITAPDLIPQVYVSPYASKILVVGLVYALVVGVRWQYDEWRKRTTDSPEAESLSQRTR